MLERIGQSLARLITPSQKINPAGEGNYHAGPYTVSGGWLPHDWGQHLNYWQNDRDPLAGPQCSIVEACVWAYIRAIAQLPGYHKRERDDGGTDIITTSALSRMLRRPNDYQTASDFLVHLIRSLLLNGNSYWIIQRNDRQEVAALHWTDPRACRVREVAVRGQASREIFYEIGDNPLLTFDGFGQNLIVPARDVFHVKLATPRHPLVGETWLSALWAALAQSCAINESLTKQARRMHPSGVIEAPFELNLTQAQVDEHRQKWIAQFAQITSGGLPVLQKGLKFHPISMSAEDQQIIEQLKYNDREVAAVFGVPPMLLGIADGGSVKSAEAQMAEWLSAGLGWLINHIEVAWDHFIGLPRGEYTEYDTAILLRSAFKERIEGLARAVQAGIAAPNEARLLEGLPRVTDGDVPFLQQQMIPITLAANPPKPAPPPAPLPMPDDEQEDEDEDDVEDDEDEQRAVLAYHIRDFINDRTAA